MPIGTDMDTDVAAGRTGSIAGGRGNSIASLAPASRSRSSRGGGSMAKLSTESRNNLPGKDFAVKGRKYPIEDKAHARNAMSRVAQNGTPEEKAEVQKKVGDKFPTIGKNRGASSTAVRKTARRKHVSKKRM